MDINLKVEIGLAPQAIECVTLLACAIDGTRGKVPAQAAQAPAQAPATQTAPSQAAQAPAQAQQPAPGEVSARSRDICDAAMRRLLGPNYDTDGGARVSLYKPKIVAKIQQDARTISNGRTDLPKKLTMAELDRLEAELRHYVINEELKIVTYEMPF